MVSINVKEGLKYVGISAFISFPYDIRYVNLMRAQPDRYWHSTDKCWEIPYTNISLVLDKLQEEDYKITVDSHIQSKLENTLDIQIPETYTFITKPFQHQTEGIEYGLNHKKFLLADEQGLGKTKQMIDLACINKQLYDYEHCLIIACVNGLKYNWQEEIGIHSNESGYILGTRHTRSGKCYIGSNKDRLYDLQHLEDINDYFIITNIETLRYTEVTKVPCKTKGKGGVTRYKKVTKFPIVEELQKLIHKGNISMIVADEIHKCLAGNTLILTNRGNMTIKDIVQQQDPNIKIGTFTKDNKLDYVTPAKYFVNPITKNMLQLDIETKEGIKTVVCTPNHKFLTKNRGYVEACNLTSDDILEEFTNG